MVRASEVVMEPEKLTESPMLVVVIVAALVAGLVALMVWDSRRRGRAKGQETAAEPEADAPPAPEGQDVPGGAGP
jgi:heme/copper-type cytochrome/quinol oxidase subunit 2